MILLQTLLKIIVFENATGSLVFAELLDLFFRRRTDQKPPPIFPQFSTGGEIFAKQSSFPFELLV